MLKSFKYLAILALSSTILMATEEQTETQETTEKLTIHQAAQKGDIMRFQYLTEVEKVDAKQPNEDGNTPLLLALMGYRDFKQKLKEDPSQFYTYPVDDEGNKIEGEEPDTWTASMLIGGSYYNIINCLLCGSDLTIPNKAGVSPQNLLNDPLLKDTFKSMLKTLEFIRKQGTR